MKKGLKLFLSLLSAVVFAISMVFFIIGIAKSGTVDENEPDKYPIVYLEEIEVAGKDTNFFDGQLVMQTVRLEGLIKNVDNQSHYIELYVFIEYEGDDGVDRTQSFEVDSFTLGAGETKRIFTIVRLDTDKTYREVEYATAVIQSIPHRIVENQTYFHLEAYVIPAGILMVAGLVCFFIFIGIKPKYVEQETIVSVDAPYLNNMTQDVSDSYNKSNDASLVECEYCGCLNKLADGKCSACGANLKKGKRK